MSKEVEKKKKSFLESIAEKDLYEKLEEMGNSRSSIDKMQKNRFMQSLMFFIILVVTAQFVGTWFYILALVLPVFMYKQKYKSLNSQYNVWRFHRHLQFSKFMRLLIPYLKQSAGTVSLYTIFNKILQRTESEHDRNSLYKLMTEMTAEPDSIQPFIDFAERSSGTDMSVLFMSTIFDYQQSTHDVTVIEELGQIASKELMDGIDEIIHFKLRRFVYFPTKIVMSSFIIVVGYAAAVLVHQISEFNFMGG